jgi:hypothetical protein
MPNTTNYTNCTICCEGTVPTGCCGNLPQTLHGTIAVTFDPNTHNCCKNQFNGLTVTLTWDSVNGCWKGSVTGNAEGATCNNPGQTNTLYVVVYPCVVTNWDVESCIFCGNTLTCTTCGSTFQKNLVPNASGNTCSPLDVVFNFVTIGCDCASTAAGTFTLTE